jgi:agmatine/peptidylarginine deiminase
MSVLQEEVATLAAVDGSVPRLAGERMAGSYVNFYICNGGVVMPAFGQPEQDAAAKQVRGRAGFAAVCLKGFRGFFGGLGFEGLL